MKQTTTAVHLPDGDTNGDTIEKTLSFEQIFREIGECGRYQITIGVTTGLVLAFGSFTIMNFVFSSIVPDHR